MGDTEKKRVACEIETMEDMEINIKRVGGCSGAHIIVDGDLHSILGSHFGKHCRKRKDLEQWEIVHDFTEQHGVTQFGFVYSKWKRCFYVFGGFRRNSQLQKKTLDVIRKYDIRR